MTDFEYINLCWKEFQKTTTTTFTNLRGQEDFTDITLVCNTGRQVKAHKVILSAVSSLFKTVFEQNPHQHPLIYLKGVSFKDLNCILDFIYLGEVKVIQEELVTFLNVAEELQIDGLKQQEDKQKTDQALNIKVELPVDRQIKSAVCNETIFYETGETFNPINRRVDRKHDKSCNACDYTSNFKSNLNRHKRKFHGSNPIEIGANFEPEIIACKRCGIKQRNRENLEIHMQLEHKQNSRKYPSNCGYKATFTSNLRRHTERIHVGGPSRSELKSALVTNDETENQLLQTRTS